MKLIKKLFLFGFICFLLIIIWIKLINTTVQNKTKSIIYTDINNIDKKTSAIMILGAWVKTWGIITPIYKERINKAIQVYNSWKSDKILVSADNSREEYDEVLPVRDYLVNNGVNANDIFLDFAGFDTYDSLYRARDIFEVNSLFIISQWFHLPRAVWIGNKLGVESYGIEADSNVIRSDWYTFREKIANIKAWLNILFRVEPKFLGEKVPIDWESNAYKHG